MSPVSREDPSYELRHSAAHVLAQAVKEVFPEAKLGWGPPHDRFENGFYYDFELPRLPGRGRRALGEDRREDPGRSTPEGPVHAGRREEGGRGDGGQREAAHERGPGHNGALLLYGAPERGGRAREGL